MFGELKKEPFCQCLHEIENGLPRSKHCFQTCNDQWLILAKRKELKEKVIIHLRAISKQDQVMRLKSKPEGILIKDLVTEVENETLTGKEYFEMYYSTIGDLKNRLITDLKEIKDQDSVIQISPDKQVTIKQLIDEIENARVMGVEYLKLYAQIENLPK